MSADILSCTSELGPWPAPPVNSTLGVKMYSHAVGGTLSNDELITGKSRHHFVVTLPLLKIQERADG